MSGETFRYLGRQHRLRVEWGNEVGVRLLEGRLVVTTTQPASAVAGPGAVRTALVDWYRACARRRLRVLAERLAPAVGVPVPRLLVRDQYRRWGSCDAMGTLRLNWRIIQAPMRLVEYVVAHELVHLRHPDHTTPFWAALGRVMPDYERRRDELREAGGTFDW